MSRHAAPGTAFESVRVGRHRAPEPGLPFGIDEVTQTLVYTDDPTQPIASRPALVAAAVDVAVDEELGRQVKHGLKWSFVNNVVSRAGQVVVGIVLARLLTPYDYGVFAAALIAYAVLISCSELGVTVALVSRRGDSRTIGPTVTSLSWASGAVLTIAIWLTAPTIADHLHTPAAAGVLRVLGLAIFVAGLSAAPSAIVQRDFQQRTRFAADTANFVVSTVVAIVGVALGGGALALAWSRVAGNAVAAVIVVLAARERYRPGWNRAVAKDLLAFGLPLTGASALAFAVLNVDYVVVAGVLGPVALGYYLIAFNLSSFPVTAFSTVVRSVSLPAFGRLRDRPDQAGPAFVDATRLLVLVSAPVAVLLAVLGRPLIDFLYGSVWVPAALPLAFLAGLGLFRVFHELGYDYLTARGKPRLVLLIQLGWLVALGVLLPVGAHLRALPGIGIGHLIAAFGLVLPAYLLVLRRYDIALGPLLRVVLRPVLGAAATAAVALAARFGFTHPLPELLVGGAGGVLVYLAVVGPQLPGRFQALSPWSWLRMPRPARITRIEETG
ncbi:MAG TPA: lipopolysaccharide biosynthesis protein [Mycobacteriales bacterium]|nr:lipopolysaccharide biosynthesis protein [Mycobacteriales bacterium]